MNMSRVVSFLGGASSLSMALLGREHDAVLRLVVDLELRVIGPHVALAAGRRQASDLDRGGVPRMAGGAAADRAVRVRLADAVALDAALDHRSRPFRARRGNSAGRLHAPGWNFSEKATCSADSPFSP